MVRPPTWRYRTIEPDGAVQYYPVLDEARHAAQRAAEESGTWAGVEYWDEANPTEADGGWQLAEIFDAATKLSSRPTAGDGTQGAGGEAPVPPTV